MIPKVSVCIPVYNGVRYLRECLDSVLGQVFQDLEILIVDDGSVDGSKETASEYVKRDARVRLHCNARNHGLVGNWNECIRHAKGEWIKFLFQDDVLMPECVTRMLAVEDPSTDLIVARRLLVFSPDTPEAIKDIYREYVERNNLARHFPGSHEMSAEQFSSLMIDVPDRNCIGEPSATMVRKTAFERFGYFNSHLVSLCDWEYFARVATNSGLRYIDDPLAIFRVHGQSQSAELREFSNFRANTLDPLVIQHEMLYLPAYAGLRAVAARRYSKGYLKYQMAEGVKKVWWEAAVSPATFQAKAQFARLLTSHPKMLAFPLGFLAECVAKKCGAMSRSKGLL